MKRWLTAAIYLLATACGMPGPAADEVVRKGLDRGFYSVPALGRRVAYLRGGTPGGRRVIFVHGTPGEAGGWADFLLNAPAGFEYFAVDRPGFGETRPTLAEPSLVRQVAALIPLLDTAQPPILVGHSYGAPVIAQLAADHPGRIGGLVIVAGALDPAQEKVYAMQHVGEWPGVRRLLPAALRNANRELIPLKAELEALAPKLARINAPVTIIHGTADSLVPIANVGYMELRFTGSREVKSVILRDQSHFLPWEHRPVIERAILELAQP